MTRVQDRIDTWLLSMQVTDPWPISYASTTFSSAWMNNQQAMCFCQKRLDGWEKGLLFPASREVRVSRLRLLFWWGTLPDTSIARWPMGKRDRWQKKKARNGLANKNISLCMQPLLEMYRMCMNECGIASSTYALNS